MIIFCLSISFFFFFNDTATTEIYTFPYTTLFRSPLDDVERLRSDRAGGADYENPAHRAESREGSVSRSRAPRPRRDRKSTRLNSSHSQISYAVFCLKKKKKKKIKDKD